jgi:glycyl-tRNA synthetase beta subunit
MPDLLLELLTEEIPARMQAVTAEEFGRLIATACDEAKLAHAGIATYVTPRRSPSTDCRSPNRMRPRNAAGPASGRPKRRSKASSKPREFPR